MLKEKDYLIKRNTDVKVIRKMLGITSEKFGNMVCLSRQTISSLETGKSRLTRHIALLFNYALREYIRDNNLIETQTTVFVKKVKNNKGVNINK